MATKAAGSMSEATRQKMAERAYLIWESQGRPHGYDRQHWIQAEAEILGKGTKTAAKTTAKTTAKKSTAAIAKSTVTAATATAAMAAGSSTPAKGAKKPGSARKK